MAEGISSFWGPVTSTTEWCEQNYVYSSYIAEFFNTISNIPCILLAFIGLVNALRQRFEKRFSVLHLSNMILAIGSMLFHATLQRLLLEEGKVSILRSICGAHTGSHPPAPYENAYLGKYLVYIFVIAIGLKSKQTLWLQPI